MLLLSTTQTVTDKRRIHDSFPNLIFSGSHRMDTTGICVPLCAEANHTKRDHGKRYLTYSDAARHSNNTLAMDQHMDRELTRESTREERVQDPERRQQIKDEESISDGK